MRRTKGRYLQCTINWGLPGLGVIRSGETSESAEICELGEKGE